MAAVTQFHPYPGTPPARAKPCWWPCTAGRARRFAGACADLRERRGNFAVAMTQEGPRVAGLPESRQALALPTSKAAKRRSEEHTSELQSLMRISYAVFCLKKTKTDIITY